MVEACVNASAATEVWVRMRVATRAQAPVAERACAGFIIGLVMGGG